VKSRLVTWLVVFGGLALAGLGLRPVEAPLWAAIRAGEPALRLDSRTAATEQGVVLGLLGGLRAAVADIVWLRADALAERHDLPATESALKLVTVIDPRPLYFWLNGARIVAYDMPGWRVAAAGGYATVPVAAQERIGREQAQRALALLDEAMKFHPASASLWIERANLELNRLGDVPGAAASYRRAWEQPNAPFYAARLHAELLRRQGRQADALAWLVRLHPQLPAGDESAGADLVLARIRDLERELGVPAAQAYRPADGMDP
jgi:hypothetical protein